MFIPGFCKETKLCINCRKEDEVEKPNMVGIVDV